MSDETPESAFDALRQSIAEAVGDRSVGDTAAVIAGLNQLGWHIGRIEEWAAVDRAKRTAAEQAAPPDYTAMNGAEFQRAVGADPAKWAAAFLQSWAERGWHVSELSQWFADAMHAAVKAHGTPLRDVATMPLEELRQTVRDELKVDKPE